MPGEALAGFVAETAERLGVTGAAVGVWADGKEDFGCHGVTSVENPLSADRDTLFLIGSVTKTFTATAVMRLVADGTVALDAPVRRYVRSWCSRTSGPRTRSPCSICSTTPRAWTGA